MRIRTLPQFDEHNGWYQILPPSAAANRAQGKLKADFVVLGAGFAGLAAARRLAELKPEAAITLVDAGRIGNNAAGRCSGFAIDQAHNIRAKNFAASLDHERDQLSLNRAGQAYLREVVQARRIECDWREEGKIHGAATPHGEDQLDAYARNLELLQAEHRSMDKQEMQAMCGTDFYRSGLFTPGTVLIQPAALVRGLAETMPANVTVFEDSPVVSVHYGRPHRLETPEAEIETNTLLLANNGFSTQFGFYRRHLIPLSTFGSLTAPMNAEQQAQLGGRESWGIIPADPFGTSVRRVADGRILIRNIYSYSSGLNHEEATRRWAATHHERSLANRFPMLPELRFEYTWGGALALSRNGAPVFGELADGVHGSLYCNGVGIARGTICGKLLAEGLCGEDSDLLSIMQSAERPNRNVPDPFLKWGVEINFARRRKHAGLEL